MPILFLLVLRFEQKEPEDITYSKDKNCLKIHWLKGSKDTKSLRRDQDSWTTQPLKLQKMLQQITKKMEINKHCTREVKDTSSKEDKHTKSPSKTSGDPSSFQELLTEEDSSRLKNWSRVHILKEETLSSVRRRRDNRKQERQRSTKRDQRENQGGITAEEPESLLLMTTEERTQISFQEEAQREQPGERIQTLWVSSKSTKSKHRDRKKKLSMVRKEIKQKKAQFFSSEDKPKKERRSKDRGLLKKRKSTKREKSEHVKVTWRNKEVKDDQTGYSYFFDAILISITQKQLQCQHML